MMRCAAFICAGVMISACAKFPDEIQPALASDVSFQEKTCPQLASEFDKLNAALLQASRFQHIKAEKDSLGVFLIGVPASADMPDRAMSIATTKGQLEAISRVAVVKHCPPLPEMAGRGPFLDARPE
jgi:hypothetical protein